VQQLDDTLCFEFLGFLRVDLGAGTPKQLCSLATLCAGWRQCSEELLSKYLCLSLQPMHAGPHLVSRSEQCDWLTAGARVGSSLFQVVGVRPQGSRSRFINGYVLVILAAAVEETSYPSGCGAGTFFAVYAICRFFLLVPFVCSKPAS
jgi:hypothetical protein